MRTNKLVYALMALMLLLLLVSSTSATNVKINVWDGQGNHPMASVDVYRNGIGWSTWIGKTTMTQWYVWDNNINGMLGNPINYHASWGNKYGTVSVYLDWPYTGTKEVTLYLW